MRQPSWRSPEGDSRFWNARGTVRTLLGTLYELALAPLRLNRRVEIGFRQSITREHLYLYQKDVESIRKLARTYPDDQEFFKALESTLISELLSEVRIRVRTRNTDGSLTFRELSEGEQQLLMVLGLLRFTREDESLFLLDEPDTHLNPAWSLQYRSLLNKYAGADASSHIIMATHDPLVVADLVRAQVQILERDDETGRVDASIPDLDPRGMGIASLLTSEVYGLRSQLDLATLRKLDRQRELGAMEELSPDEREELARLSRELIDLDFTTTVRDPLYKEFVRAMTAAEREEGLDVPVLTREQQERQQELAADILRELMDNQGSASA
jgi:predicted ATPase